MSITVSDVHVHQAATVERLAISRSHCRTPEQDASAEKLPSPPEVLAYAQRAGDETRVAAVDFADRPPPRDHDGQDERFSGRLLGEQALLLWPEEE